MLNNTISAVGWGVVLIGWFILLVIPGHAETSVVNIHRLHIAGATILSGFALVIIGMLKEVLDRGAERSAGTKSSENMPGMAAAPNGIPSDGELSDNLLLSGAPDFNKLKKTHRLGSGLSNGHEVYELAEDYFVFQTSAGWRASRSLEDAKKTLGC